MGTILIIAFIALIFLENKGKKDKPIEHKKFENPRDDRFEV
jgi:hypothetical protein